MTDFAYSTVPGKLPQLLDKIRTVGVPARASVEWLASIGFKSSNDRSMLPVLKYIGLADNSGAPTQAWRHLRGGNSGTVLAEAIRKGYRAVFATYPEAWQCSKQDLQNFFSTHSSAGEQVVEKTVATFLALCGKATFALDSELSDEESDESDDLVTPPVPRRDGRETPPRVSAPPVGPQGPPQPSVHVDVQIHISHDASAAQIDKIFESMAKHLYGRQG